MTHTVSRTIHAPKALVFETISDIRKFSQVVPEIVNVEILSEVQSGVGTRFRETRLMRGRESKVELEVTEFVDGEHVRIVSDAGGTVWDSVFTVAEAGDGTELTLRMDARPHTFMARIMNVMIRGFLQKALEKDMDAVKVACEDRGD